MRKKKEKKKEENIFFFGKKKVRGREKKGERESTLFKMHITFLN